MSKKGMRFLYVKEIILWNDLFSWILVDIFSLENEETAVGADGLVHIRVQNRKQKKKVTTITGFNDNVDFKAVLYRITHVWWFHTHMFFSIHFSWFLQQYKCGGSIVQVWSISFWKISSNYFVIVYSFLILTLFIGSWIWHNYQSSGRFPWTGLMFILCFKKKLALFFIII